MVRGELEEALPTVSLDGVVEQPDSDLVRVGVRDRVRVRVRVRVRLGLGFRV